MDTNTGCKAFLHVSGTRFPKNDKYNPFLSKYALKTLFYVLYV